MENDAGDRDTLSSGKKGYRAMLARLKEEGENSSLKAEKATCPKKASPDHFGLGL